MTMRLCACLLLIVLLHGPAHGQGVGSPHDRVVENASMDIPAHAMGKSAMESSGTVAMDAASDFTREETAQAGLSALGFASRVIEILATQNTIDLFRQSTDELDAYLRPPQEEEESVFRMARTAYLEATSIQSEAYVISVDPLKMRWTVRLNLNRPFGQ